MGHVREVIPEDNSGRHHFKNFRPYKNVGYKLDKAVRAAFWRMGFDIQRVSKELSKIPGVELVDLLGDAKAKICFTVQKYEDGIAPVNDMVALLSLLAANNPREVL